MMQVHIITLFPHMFDWIQRDGVTGRAHQQGIWSLRTWNPREYTHNVHQTVDDRPYGGGPGMVMMAPPLMAAVEDIHAVAGDTGPVILLSPMGRPFTQQKAHALSQLPAFTLVCGRYEGIDQRFVDRCVDEVISLGDFVLSGGEIAALAVLDATARLLPGVLNDEQSAVQDSFSPALSGLLDCEHYTRPADLDGVSVPSVLLSGDHARIAQWRRQRSLCLTQMYRPDLLKKAELAGSLSDEDRDYLNKIQQTLANSNDNC